MILSETRYEEIKRIATQTLSKSGIREIPIDVFRMAKNLGIRIQSYSSRIPALQIQRVLSIYGDGFSCEEKKQPLVMYNDLKNSGRINNTIMHEIAHLILGHTENSILAETEANFFAKFILAPPVLIHEKKLFSVELIVKHFGISLEAAQYALNYYQKWRAKVTEYSPYEKTICQLFNSQERTLMT